jgi:drug/metabolite transporter (DMT)-like permease
MYSVGTGFMAMGARGPALVSAHRHREFLWVVVRSRVWQGGLWITFWGFPLQLWALGLAPLVVVAPAMSAGLIVILFVGVRMLGERVGCGEVVAVLLIALGGVGLALTAPSRTTYQARALTFVAVFAALLLVAMAPVALGRASSVRARAWAALASSGVCFALGAVTAKLMSDAMGSGDVLGAVGAFALTGVLTGAGVAGQTIALARLPAVLVSPSVFVIQTAVPVALAPLLLHERISSTPLHGAVLLASIAVMVLAAARLTRSPLLQFAPS